MKLPQLSWAADISLPFYPALSDSITSVFLKTRLSLAGKQPVELFDLLFLLGACVTMAVLILVPRRMTFMIVMHVRALLFCRHRGVSMAMRIKVTRGVPRMIVMRTRFLRGLLCSHAMSPG